MTIPFEAGIAFETTIEKNDIQKPAQRSAVLKKPPVAESPALRKQQPPRVAARADVR